jgi:hypothetical protein
LKNKKEGCEPTFDFYFPRPFQLSLKGFISKRCVLSKLVPKIQRYNGIPISKTIPFLECLGPISFAHSHTCENIHKSQDTLDPHRFSYPKARVRTKMECLLFSLPIQVKKYNFEQKIWDTSVVLSKTS